MYNICIYVHIVIYIPVPSSNQMILDSTLQLTFYPPLLSQQISLTMFRLQKSNQTSLNPPFLAGYAPRFPNTQLPYSWIAGTGELILISGFSATKTCPSMANNNSEGKNQLWNNSAQTKLSN